MTTATLNTRLDALARIVEDVVVVAGAAGAGASTWLATHDVAASVAAVGAVPAVRAGAAQLLSKGRVSGLVLALKVVWQAIGVQANTPAVVPAGPAVASASPVALPAPVVPPVTP